MRNALVLFLFAAILSAPNVLAQKDALEEAGLYAPSVWDLEPGAHARELPTDAYIDYACGTRGGPPARPLADWTGYAKCQPEPDSGFHEVYFQYDDEPEYWAKARRLESQANLYQYTSAYAIPVIVSVLFDPDGFMMGFRMVTDDRVDVSVREKGSTLSGYLMGRYDRADWACKELPRLEGERAYQGILIKRECLQRDSKAGLDLFIEWHHLRGAGQFVVNPANGLPMAGQFESTTHFEAILRDGVSDREARLAALPAPGPTEIELLIERALDCPGCDLSGAKLKRADLAGANLVGANLSGANLHGANLAGANLAGANLEKANLNRAIVRRANLRGANLSQAMMYEARFDRADLSGARLQGAFGSKVQMIRADVSNANLSLMDLRDARLHDANFSGSNINQSWLDGAQLARSNLAGANIILTTLRNASFVEADLSQADFSASDLYGVNLRGANLTGANFTNSRLSYANMAQTQIDGAIFDNALLPPGFEPAAP